MMKKRTIFSTAAAVLLCSCIMKHANSIKKTDWLIGTWEQKTSEGSIYETWNKAGENELKGKSYMLKNKDTILFETIRLIGEKGRFYYIPAVRDQNEGVPIRFQGKTISETQLVFENKTHDFPQIISYAKINEDSLKAEISGTRKGKNDHRYFLMKRIK